MASNLHQTLSFGSHLSVSGFFLGLNNALELVSVLLGLLLESLFFLQCLQLASLIQLFVPLGL
jgi:hypothetical protein